MPQSDFLFGLNDIAMYAAARGSPLFLPSHIAFLAAYVREWLRTESGLDNQKAAVEALFRRAPTWARNLSLRLYQAHWIPSKARLPLLLTPFFIRMAFNLPLQFIWSGVKSAWDILRKGVRNVPPLVTAVVVVFVTSDAWRILGTGFTLRFFMLVCAFLVAQGFGQSRFRCSNGAFRSLSVGAWLRGLSRFSAGPGMRDSGRAGPLIPAFDH